MNGPLSDGAIALIIMVSIVAILALITWPQGEDGFTHDDVGTIVAIATQPFVGYSQPVAAAQGDRRSLGLANRRANRQGAFVEAVRHPSPMHKPPTGAGSSAGTNSRVSTAKQAAANAAPQPSGPALQDEPWMSASWIRTATDPDFLRRLRGPSSTTEEIEIGPVTKARLLKIAAEIESKDSQILRAAGLIDEQAEYISCLRRTVVDLCEQVGTLETELDERPVRVVFAIVDEDPTALSPALASDLALMIALGAS